MGLSKVASQSIMISLFTLVTPSASQSHFLKTVLQQNTHFKYAINNTIEKTHKYNGKQKLNHRETFIISCSLIKVQLQASEILSFGEIKRNI